MYKIDFNEIQQQEKSAYVDFWPRVAAPSLGFSLIVTLVGGSFTLIQKMLYDAHIIKYEVTIIELLKTLVDNADKGSLVFYPLIFYISYILYLSFMESGPRQASLGKIMIGAKVVDKNGNRVSFFRALLRNILKLFSIISIVGIFMIGFTRKRTALHDLICGTYVIRST